MDELEEFLARSPLARSVSLPTRVVVHRGQLTPRQLVQMRGEGTYGPLAAAEAVCELEVNGTRVARGRIVKRRGRTFFVYEAAS